MLTPEYIQQLTDAAEDIAEQLHNDVIGRIIRRVLARLNADKDYVLTATDKWAVETLRASGELGIDIADAIARNTPLMQSEVLQAFIDAGVQTITLDNAVYSAVGIDVGNATQTLASPYYYRLMERNYKATLGTMENFTRTIVGQSQRTFIEACDKAYNLVTSHSVGYTQAVKEAVDSIANKGVTVQYPSGHTDTIETATLRAVRTGVAQMSGEIALERMDEYKHDIVIVSAHLGARYGDGGQNHTNHFWWQGKFYSRSGQDKRFPRFDVCGLGYVDGLHGVNCRHSFGAGDGEHNPYKDFDSDENKRVYDETQRQRLLERRIRKTKRGVMALKEAVDNAPDDATRQALYDDYAQRAKLLQKQNKAYKDYCEAHKLKTRQDRVTIAQWDRAQAAAATAAARKAK